MGQTGLVEHCKPRSDWTDRPGQTLFTPIRLFRKSSLIKDLYCLVILSSHLCISQKRKEEKKMWATAWQIQQTKCAPSEDSDQPWSESSLCTQWVAKDQRFLHADSEDSDQTGRMPRLIWVFAGRTLILLVLCENCRISTEISSRSVSEFLGFLWY